MMSAFTAFLRVQSPQAHSPAACATSTAAKSTATTSRPAAIAKNCISLRGQSQDRRPYDAGARTHIPNCARDPAKRALVSQSHRRLDFGAGDGFTGIVNSLFFYQLSAHIFGL